MDGALARARPVDGVDVIAYAGRNEVDLQPKPDHPSDSYTIFGAKLRTSRLLGSLMTLLGQLDRFSLAERRAVTVPLLKRMVNEEGAA